MVQVLVWAGQNNPKSSGSQRGDLVEWLEDGVHPGPRVVSGPAWNDPADYSSEVGRALTPAEMQAGMRPDFNVVDIAGVTIAQARNGLAQRIASVLGLQVIPRRLKWVPKLARIDPQQLPAAARASLRDNGRVSATGAQLWSVLALKAGVTLAKIRAWVTDNERRPTEWTTEE